MSVGQIGFDERVAIITGAGGGLGKAYALELAKRGAKIKGTSCQNIAICHKA